jgi:L,D-transpeptidase catalytic domain
VSRLLALFNVLALALLAACAGPTDEAPTRPGAVANTAFPNGVALSPTAHYVSQIASRNGDRDYLMLDKKNGRIVVFEKGRPTFSGAALTGENLADRLEPDAMSKSFAEQKGFKYKVTPAGRYTVSTGWDNAYGETLDLNEIQGSDWDISIHKVWLGAPAERRDARLRSPGGGDKHITYGCIDVDGPTMQQLIARLPDENHTPIYILPEDERLVDKLFQPRGASREATAPAG